MNHVKSPLESPLATPPSLPIELERHIFELAFDRFKPAYNARLCLVSRYTYAWIKPLIYGVFVQLLSQTPYPDLKNLSDSSLQDKCELVRSMAIDRTRHTSTEAADLMGRCHNLENLLCWSDINIQCVWPVMLRLPKLRQLSANFYGITLDDLREAPWTSNLTHLLLITHDTKHSWQIDTDFASLFSNLTHLAFLPGSGIDFRLLEDALQSLKQLRVLCYFIHYDVDLQPGLSSIYATESRMVVFDAGVYSSDAWVNGAWGDSNDSWKLAEGIVFARQNGLFKSNEYQIKTITARFSWRDYLTEKGIEWYEANITDLIIPWPKEQYYDYY